MPLNQGLQKTKVRCPEPSHWVPSLSSSETVRRASRVWSRRDIGQSSSTSRVKERIEESQGSFSGGNAVAIEERDDTGKCLRWRGYLWNRFLRGNASTHRWTGAGSSDRTCGTTRDNLETTCLCGNIGVTTASSVVFSTISSTKGLDERSRIIGLIWGCRELRKPQSVMISRKEAQRRT